MSPLLSRIALSAAMLACASQAAEAQMAVSELDLEALLNPTVTAPTKRAQSAREVPATVVVLTDEDLRVRGYQDLEDALRDLPGVTFMDNALAESGGARIVFRGQPGNDKIALLLNGHRVLNASRPQDGPPIFLRTFPLAYVKRLEVVYGPGSALYGADAVSAVINIVTKDGVEASGVSFGSGYGLRDTTSSHLGYGTAIDGYSNFLVMGRFFRTAGEDFDRFPQFVASAADRQFWPGSKARDASASSDVELVSYRNQGFSLDFMRTAANSATAAAGMDARYASNDQARWMVSTNTLNLDYTTLIGPVVSSTTLTYDQIGLNPNSQYLFNPKGDSAVSDPALRQAFIHGYKYGMGRAARLEQTFVHEASEDLAMVGGLVAEDHSTMPPTIDLPRPMDPNRSATDQGFGPLGINWLQYQNYGLYGQLQLGYMPGLSTTLGGRFDYNTRYEPIFTPRLGAVYHLTPEMTLKASYLRSYMAPFVGDMYATWGAPGDYMWFPNPDLRPVRGQSVEVSAQYDFTPNHAMVLAIYRNDFTDQVGHEDVAPRVVEGQPTPGSRFVNIDQSAILGSDLMLTARLADELDGYASASLMDAKLFHSGSVAGVPVPDTVAASGRLGLIYRPRRGLSLNPRLTWLSGRATTPDNPTYHGATIPGVWLLDLAVRAKLNGQVSLYLTGSNLLDQWHYANSEYQSFTLGGAIPQNGRRLQAGVTYAF